MSNLEILTYPNDILTTPTTPLTKADILSSEIQTLIEDMKDTIIAYGGVGLAANQVGVHKALFLIRYKDGFGVFINPEVKSKKGHFHCKGEGCLSVPEKRFNVKRFKKIELSYIDEHGEEAYLITHSKRHAQEIQHEIDHLNGVILAEKGKRI